MFVPACAGIPAGKREHSLVLADSIPVNRNSTGKNKTHAFLNPFLSFLKNER